MSLSRQLASQWGQLVGTPLPRTLQLAADKQIAIEIDLTAIDSLSCAAREIRLTVPALSAGDFDALREWAERLSRRVTYLLENIGPLELDPASGRVLLRSTQPEQQDGAKRYYEILLQSQSGGQFSLRRYRYEKGTAGREPVDLSLTQEVLGKLLTDLVETAPGA